MGSSRLATTACSRNIATVVLVHGNLGSLWNGMPILYDDQSWIVVDRAELVASLFYGVVDSIGGGAALRISFGVTTGLLTWLVWKLAARRSRSPCASRSVVSS